jgi:hypothetical protein
MKVATECTERRIVRTTVGDRSGDRDEKNRPNDRRKSIATMITYLTSSIAQ